MLGAVSIAFFVTVFHGKAVFSGALAQTDSIPALTTASKTLMDELFQGAQHKTYLQNDCSTVAGDVPLVRLKNIFILYCDKVMFKIFMTYWFKSGKDHGLC